MVRQIDIKQYRKLKDISLNFSKGVNVISGTNGTCKSSLLYIISNAFQEIDKKCSWVNDYDTVTTIKKINYLMNPKIESLSLCDKATYKDPARDVKGALFNVQYFDREPLDFRRHNSKRNNRYAVKPAYKKGSGDSLPSMPVIYLGLSRLVPFGEFQHDEQIHTIKDKLPIEYQNEIADLFRDFTNININISSSEKMGELKIRSDFSSNYDGIDSNTVSAGEDNLFIILSSLVSLKYYFQSINTEREVESILLIDELDATLHTAYQIKLFDIFRKYSNEHKIQIFFTTHSLLLLEHALKTKTNSVYLLDQHTRVGKMDPPNIYTIKLNLYNKTRNDMYSDKRIPVFSEDEEARLFIEQLFRHFEKKNRELVHVFSLFHLVSANIGCSELKNIFTDDTLMNSNLQSICILDGDQILPHSYLNKHLIKLPGNASPEKQMIDYIQNLYDEDSDFWDSPKIIENNYSKTYYQSDILPEIRGIQSKCEECRAQNKSTEGIERKMNKELFKKHTLLFRFLFIHWLNNDKNKTEVQKFYEDLQILFRKVAGSHDIDPKIWDFN